ncbi:FAD-dependent oxidoreductase [Methanobacterium alcaliphilum]|uniref:FAD-dependent oxidoreductase n=1 Tax=Methanobacterium alcaliphilum TaxID=392018 RepID=UPI00200AA491|nr:NAD(P)/FAD-dependent oxidoreductase [Methanobacterium alcaliphilum]MCK9152621.1 NAD(P)/FAD-dependent oxidoreductase [Methanobacterium alcaliphilum]
MKVIVIGGGPAGRAAALELASLDNEVTLIEKNRIGGTCLNEGCMVICGLNDISRFLNDAKNLQANEIMNIQCDFNYSDIANGIKETLNKIRHVTEKETVEAGIKLIYSEATISDKLVNLNKKTLEYDKLIIATGGRPFIPPIKGIEHTINYKNLLNIKELPESLIIVGSGVIAAEIANIFSSMGSEVHVLCRNNFLGILKSEISDYIAEYLLKNVHIHKNITIHEIKEDHALTSEGKIEGLVFLATGTIPNSEIVKDILKTGPRGQILVNDKMETSHPGIYAAGDVIGSIGTTPVGRMEGVTAARNAAGIETHINYKSIPHSISLNYDVAFLEDGPSLPLSNSKSSKSRPKSVTNGHIPGSAGPGSFWRVLSGHTGFSELGVDLETGDIESVLSISPSARNNLAYISLLSRLDKKTYDFEKFVETHPSTDSLYKLMRFFSKY